MAKPDPESLRGQKNLIKAIKSQSDKVRKEMQEMRKQIQQLEKKLKSSRDDAQLANIEIGKWARDQQKMMTSFVKVTETLRETVVETTRKLP